MKKKDKQSIQGSSEAELRKQIGAISKQLVDMSVSRYTKQQKNTRETRLLRLKRAVMMTALRQKELHHG